MSNLISGKEALIALANGETIQFKSDRTWSDVTHMLIMTMLNDVFEFRLKPKTIMLGNIEVPAPFEPKEGEDCRCYYVSTNTKLGYDWKHSSHHHKGSAVWRTEEEIKQVVEALRSVFK